MSHYRVARRLHSAALWVSSLVLLAAGGCSGRSGSNTYYLVANNLKLPYWQTVSSGFSRAAMDLRVKTQTVGPDTYDAAAELDAFRQAVAARPAGILISVADAGVFRSDINDAVQAGIPVITVDSDAPMSQRLFFIGTDNLAAGHLGGERLVEKLHGKGNVVFFSIPGQPNLDERLRGYKDVMSDHPAMKVVDVLNVKGDSNLAFDQAKQYVAKTGADKVDGFVALESSSAPAIADVLQRANAKDRTVIGMDVSTDLLNLIKSGAVDSTVSQKPWTMGYVGLAQLEAIHHHKPDSFKTNYEVDLFAPYPDFVNTGTALITTSNADIYMESAKQANQ